MKLKEGILLIAKPQMTDPQFFKTVILLIHHNNKESIGLVLNQDTDLQLIDLIELKSKQKFPVYIGGPVQKNTLHYIHTKGEKIKNAKHIKENIYWGGDFNQVKNLIEENKITPNEIRFFAGYSGWTNEQLKNEIIEGSWITKDANTKLCMQYYKTHDVWRKHIKNINKYAIWSNMPNNPNLN
ncbi:MAG: YqgE/AlgH family protein [Bacteroidota bacterium]|nr:YqgE/AlgH family protein [Bacteroidota bacterium]